MDNLPAPVFLYDLEKRIHKILSNQFVEPADPTPRDEEVLDVLYNVASENMAIDFDSDGVKWVFDPHRSINGLHVIRVWSESGQLPTTRKVLDIERRDRVTIYTDKKTIGWY